MGSRAWFNVDPERGLIYDIFRVSVCRKFAAFGREILPRRPSHNDSFPARAGE